MNDCTNERTLSAYNSTRSGRPFATTGSRYLLFAVLTGEGGREYGSGHGVSILGKVGDSTFDGSMALDVYDDWVSVANLLLKVHIAYLLHEPFAFVMNVYIPGNW
jgi:hypothetical protein